MNVQQSDWRDGFLWRRRLVLASVAFFGESDAAFGHDDSAFGENNGLQTRDDLEQRAQVGRARVGTGGEFEKAQREIFGE